MKTFRHPCRVTSLAYTPDGGTLFSADGAGVVRAWDLASETNVVVLRDRAEQSRGILEVSPDGRRLLTDGLLCRMGGMQPAGTPLVSHVVWLVAGWKETELDGGLATVFSPGSRLVAGHGSSGGICLWRTVDGRLIRCLRYGESLYDEYLSHPAFSPDGKTLVAVFSDGAKDSGLALWDVKKLAMRQAERVHYDKIEEFSIPLYSPDGRCLAVASGDKIHLHAVRPQMLSWTGTLPSKASDPIRTIAFSPDGKWLLTGGKDRVVRLWDVNGRQLLAEWSWNIGEINKVAFAPDGMTAAAAGRAHLLVVWDLDG